MSQETFGALLKRAMKRKRLSNPELAELLGVSPETVSRWRNDKNQPSLDFLDPLVNALDLSSEELTRAFGEPVVVIPAGGALQGNLPANASTSRRPEDYYDGVLDAAARMNFEVARMILDVRGARRRGADIPPPPVVFTPASPEEMAGLERHEAALEVAEELRRRREGRQGVG